MSAPSVFAVVRQVSGSTSEKSYHLLTARRAVHTGIIDVDIVQDGVGRIDN